MVALSGTLLVVYHICAVEHDIFLFFRGDTNILFKSVTYVFLGDRMGYGSHLAEAGTITRRDSKCRTFEYSKEPPLLSTSFFWVWVAASTTLTL